MSFVNKTAVTYQVGDEDRIPSVYKQFNNVNDAESIMAVLNLNKSSNFVKFLIPYIEQLYVLRLGTVRNAYTSKTK